MRTRYLALLFVTCVCFSTPGLAKRDHPSSPPTLTIEGAAGTLHIEGRVATGSYQKLILEQDAKSTVVLDLKKHSQSFKINSEFGAALSPDGLYLLVYREDEIDQENYRESAAIIGIAEKDFVSFQDSTGLQVTTDTPLDGWNPKAPHDLVVIRNINYKYMARPMAEMVLR